MVDENLKKVFNSYDLLRTKFKVTVLLSGEAISVRCVPHHGLYDAESYIAYVF